MPRDSNGNYTLPAGNPVVTGTVIATAWANPTLGDVANEMTNSLDRQGRGGMLAPFKFLDGTAGAPGMTWTSEPSMGFFRAGASDMGATVAGVPRMRWTSVGVDVWNTANSTWVALTGSTGTQFALLNAQNRFTNSQIVQTTDGAWNLWKDATPTYAARLALNLGFPDGIDVSLFDDIGGAWVPKFGATKTGSAYRNNTHTFLNNAGTSYCTVDTAGITMRGFGVNVYAANGADGFQFVPPANGGANGTLNKVGSLTTIQSTLNFQLISAATLSLLDSTNTVNSILQTASTGLTFNNTNAAKTFDFFSAGVPLGRLGDGGWSLLTGRGVTFSNVSDTGTRRFLMSATADVVVESRGALWHWVEPLFVTGFVSISTTTPAATGSPGNVVLVYE
jgi:hypothetical protein